MESPKAEKCWVKKKYWAQYLNMGRRGALWSIPKGLNVRRVAVCKTISRQVAESTLAL